jgi:hypothetical protein
LRTKINVWVDDDGTVCAGCDYIVDAFTKIPHGEDTAKVCLECYLKQSE